jgi:cytochrome b561
MQLLNTRDRYGLLSISLHWLMLLLLIGVYSCIELREVYPKGSETREALKTWHFVLGLTVFLLVWLRLAMAIIQQKPLIKPLPERWQQLMARLSHGALYLLMIGMPIAGWLVLSGEGKVIPFYGLSLPALMTENKQSAEYIENIHKTVGSYAYYLIALHAIAVLYHHYIKMDNTLIRMLPKQSNKS